jgi:transcription elongation GreA/GreB family factor
MIKGNKMKENQELLDKCANEIIYLNKLSEDNICYSIVFISSGNGKFKTEFKVVKYQIFINVKSDLNFGNKHISITEFEPLDFLSFAQDEIEYYHKEKAEEIKKQFQDQLKAEQDIRKAEELLANEKAKIKQVELLQLEELERQKKIFDKNKNSESNITYNFNNTFNISSPDYKSEEALKGLILKIEEIFRKNKYPFD